MTTEQLERRSNPRPMGVPSWPQIDSRKFIARHLGPETLESLEDLVAQCRQLFTDPWWSEMELNDFASTTEALTRASHEARAALEGDERAADRLTAATDLPDLLMRITATERLVARAEVGYKDSSLRRAREALAELGGATTIEELITTAPRAAATIGFDRTLFSHIERATWLTDAAHVDGDDDWAHLIVGAGQVDPEPVLPGLPETDIIRKRQPILVTGVRKRTHVHQAVAEASASRSYVAAPIVVHGAVIGFIHADRCYHRGDVTEFDAELVGVFAQGYSLALERAMVLRDLEAVRARALVYARGLETIACGTDPTGTVDSLAHLHPAWAPGATFTAPATASPAFARLTPRELQVLERMTLGEGNQAIARVLVVSEETVKSHVKNILRKLGAGNRVEAVALWHRASR